MKTTKNRKRKRKRVVNTAALGVSLLLSSTLLVGNAVSVYASPTISTDEQNAIDAFLATQPVDGDTRNIGATTPTVTPSTYTFPGIDNYVSVFRDPNGDMRLTQDEVFSCTKYFPGESFTYINVKVKDWNTVDWYKVKNTPGYEHHFTDYGRPITQLYTTRKIVVINQADNSEMTLDYPILDMTNKVINTDWRTLGRRNGVMANIPIEENDPRFRIQFSYEWHATEYMYTGYWDMEVPMEEKYSYDTIVEIDESLKTNETVVTDGDFGKKSVLFKTASGAVTWKYSDGDAIFSQYTADVIYNGLKADLDMVTSDTTITDTFGWIAFSGDVHVIPSTNRIIRVGIDYTHYVTEDGTVLKPTTYGLNPVDTIAGYQFVSSHREANGDLVHVYTVPTTPAPSTPATPATGDKTSVFASAIAMISAIFVSAITFVKRNKRV